MVRAAAKNFRGVLVVVDPADYSPLLAALDQGEIGHGRHRGEVQDRGQYLHHPKHAQAIYVHCRESGVTAVASLPAFNIAPPKGGPTDLRSFLFKYLGVDTTAGNTPSGQ